MGNQPPSNGSGNSRDDPRVHVNHTGHGPYPTPPGDASKRAQGSGTSGPSGIPGGYGAPSSNAHPHTHANSAGTSTQQQQQQQQQRHYNQQQQMNMTQQQQTTMPMTTQPNNNSMRESSSDASMSNVDESRNHCNTAEGTTPQPTLQMNIAQLSAAEDDTVPTVFRWEHGGRQVYITGTFNGWSRQIPMHRSGNDFTYIHNLKRGKHAFKFIVDDEWRFAPDQPTVADIEGRINNFIDVTDFKPYTGDRDFEREKAAAYYSTPPAAAAKSNTESGGGTGGDGNDNDNDGNKDATLPLADPDGEVFTHNMPDVDEYTKDPPPLPPHLRHIILNKPPQLQDTAALPVPQHVALNHLYCTAIKDNMMVLGITQRFRTKFVTTVYYSPELSK